MQLFICSYNPHGGQSWATPIFAHENLVEMINCDNYFVLYVCWLNVFAPSTCTLYNENIGRYVNIL